MTTRWAAGLAVAAILAGCTGGAGGAGDASAVAAAAGPSQMVEGAPAAWATKEGRWDNWKEGTFPTSAAHFEALRAAAGGGVKHTKNSVPDWSGIWTSAREAGWGTPRPRTGAAGAVGAAPAGGPQPEPFALTPKYQQMLDEELARVAKGIQWDYLSWCLPAGYPRWYTEPFLREFITTPNQTWMINEQQSEARRIYTDGRGHVPEDEAYPLFEGDSIGFWDGDTLIVHTISIKPGNWNRLQPEYSDKIETVELVRKNDKGQIETRLTAYDPESLEKPWHVIFGSRPETTPNLRIEMWSCNENNNVVKTEEGITQFVLPGEAGYKDPNTLIHTPPPGSEGN